MDDEIKYIPLDTIPRQKGIYIFDSLDGHIYITIEAKSYPEALKALESVVINTYEWSIRYNG